MPKVFLFQFCGKFSQMVPSWSLSPKPLLWRLEIKMLDLKAASVDRALSCHLTEDGTASERISGAVSPIMTSLAGSRGSLDIVSEASTLWSALSGLRPRLSDFTPPQNHNGAFFSFVFFVINYVTKLHFHFKNSSTGERTEVAHDQLSPLLPHFPNLVLPPETP